MTKTIAQGENMTTETVESITVENEEIDLLASLPKETLAMTLDRLSNFYRRFVYHPDESTYDLMALWAAHTHSMETWRATPRLFIVAPERGCGKTVQAELLDLASASPIMAATSSTAGLFAVASTNTVFLDETDNLFSSHSERKVLTSILNAGYTPGGVVLRKGGPIPVYGALAFAGIENGTMPEPTRTRCIPVQMRVGEPEDFYDPVDHLAYRDELAARFRAYAETWTYVKPQRINRNGQLWSPLMSVAVAAGGDWPSRAGRAQEVHQWHTEENEQKDVLRATREWFAEHKVDRVQSSVLADHISGYDTLPATSAKALRNRMKGYGVSPRKISNWYYFKADLEPVWSEWL